VTQTEAQSACCYYHEAAPFGKSIWSLLLEDFNQLY
jgi:hypothetical protein